MKRLISILLACVLLFAVCASALAEGKIEFWNDKLTNSDPAIVDNLAGALQTDSGVQVDIVSYPDVAAYQTAMQQSINDASAPGMFTWWNGDQLNTLAKNGLLLDLTDEWTNYYIPSGVSKDVEAALSYEGKAYAAPYAVLNNTVIYNKRAFAKAGIEAVPATFDEFLADCEKLKAAGITPIALKNDSWAGFIWFQQMLAVYDISLYTGVCDGSIPYTDQRIKDVMNAWKDMFDKGYFAEPQQSADTAKAFARDEVAMVLEPSLYLPTLTTDYGMVSGQDFDALVVPSATGAKGVVFFEVSPLAIPKATADVESSKKAVRAFEMAGTQNIMANDLGMPASGSAQITDPTIAKMVSFGGDPDHIQLVLRYYESTPAELRDVALDELAKFIYSHAPVDEVLSAIQAKADTVFKK
jgi:multiple sugar transport system substrate-binding protein